MVTAPLLQCTGLTCSVRGRALFVDAAIRLSAGTLTVLRGASGTGKSTLLRQLVGLEPAPQARRWLGTREFTRRELAAWRSQVTFSAQDAPVVDGTVEENLAFPYRYRAAGPRRLSTARARGLLDACGLGSIAFDQPAAVLSGGERHRLALVRALLWDPQVLVADEPLAGLDGAATERCWDLVAEFARRPGRAVLCTLHDDALAARADGVIGLVDGRLADASGDPP